MSFLEAFRSALGSLADHKLRSGLTMLGMIFGVGAVISMLSIGGGAERQALEMIERLGMRNVIVRSLDLDRDELEELREKSVGLAPRDARAIADAVPGVELVAPRVDIRARKVVAAGASTDEAEVAGVSHWQDELGHLALAQGRFIDRLDEERHAQVCVVGPKVAGTLFGYGSPLGSELKINDVWFEVIGVLAGGGERSLHGVSIAGTEQAIHVPVTTAIRKFDRDPLLAPLDEIVVRLAPSAPPAATAASIETLIDQIHGGAADYELVVPEALLEQSRRTQRLFNIVMGCIAGISLLVGGIGIMNIMLATVLERTREIGVRRAVGARALDIRRQFIVESFAISLLGGLSGVVMGVVIARLVAAWAEWPTVVTPGSIVLSTGVSLAVGLVSGIYPAVRAARLDPIEALRYE
jgi:putative ABC transport system permease protein